MEWNTVERAIKTQEQNKKEWARSVGVRQTHKLQHPHRVKVSPRGHEQWVKSFNTCLMASDRAAADKVMLASINLSWAVWRLPSISCHKRNSQLFSLLVFFFVYLFNCLFLFVRRFHVVYFIAGFFVVFFRFSILFNYRMIIRFSSQFMRTLVVYFTSDTRTIHNRQKWICIYKFNHIYA